MTADTRQEIMDAARAMVQTRGYNGLSFRELAKEVGVKSASVHYHFPTKGDLGAALARRYADEAIEILDGFLEASQDVGACMRMYTDVFRSALSNDNRMCLCGIMAAEHDDLPAEVRAEVDRFTDVNIRWLVKLLSRGESKAATGTVAQRALAIFAAVEGAQLVARGRGDIAVYDQAIEAYRAAGLLP
ncbi:TetR/AcrR family transcriptional regulator [Bradyrhizobium sp.]|jgi:TetR/AcrR family transcriptional repressor of nem operon|uniref:TetR/AcrR family transcriptional regulator n=1 Tax=Bradyrhizobium sp. TaxID=376 RepID=UPI002DDD392D|nr:TetR/AcrR family transcriptional regulator [Bradyrhizobium sp.]HEV2155650.1 TetR/AcrR family transcriptional regulator [Bradyrhizobium sp.]